MIGKQPRNIAIKLKLVSTNDAFLEFAICVFGFVPVELLSDLGEQDVNITITLAACTPDTLELRKAK